MAHHDVKSWPEFFAELKGGKPFDLRHNDRNYRIGDSITFHEFDDRKGKMTGEKLERTITHVLESTGPGAITPYHGLQRNYAILGFAPQRLSGRATG